MATAKPVTIEFKVTSISDAGNGRMLVAFSEHASPLAPSPYLNTLSLNLSAEDAANYFPGQLYEMKLTAK